MEQEEAPRVWAQTGESSRRILHLGSLPAKAALGRPTYGSEGEVEAGPWGMGFLERKDWLLRARASRRQAGLPVLR